MAGLNQPLPLVALFDLPLLADCHQSPFGGFQTWWGSVL